MNIVKHLRKTSCIIRNLNRNAELFYSIRADHNYLTRVWFKSLPWHLSLHATLKGISSFIVTSIFHTLAIKVVFAGITRIWGLKKPG